MINNYTSPLNFTGDFPEDELPSGGDQLYCRTNNALEADIITRLNLGRGIITYSGQDHLGHRLTGLGLSHKKTVFFIYLISLGIAVGAFVIRNTNKTEAIVLLGQVVLTAIIIFVLIEIGLKRRKLP